MALGNRGLLKHPSTKNFLLHFHSKRLVVVARHLHNRSGVGILDQIPDRDSIETPSTILVAGCMAKIRISKRKSYETHHSSENGTQKFSAT